MKGKRLLIFTVIGILLVSGCCKVYCPDNSLTLRLIHFTTAETDTILFTGYSANGLFNNPTDSFYYYGQTPQKDTMYLVPASEHFAVNKDWKIKLPGAGREFLLTTIITTQQKCPCGGGRFERISSYEINGVKRTEEEITLIK